MSTETEYAEFCERNHSRGIEELRKKAYVSADKYLSFCKEKQGMSDVELNNTENTIHEFKEKIKTCDNALDLILSSAVFDNLVKSSKSNYYDLMFGGCSEMDI